METLKALDKHIDNIKFPIDDVDKLNELEAEFNALCPEI
jgi:hypothetical protein